MSGKQANWPYVFNLGNSIIGVSVLAMPFCFKECGVLLGMLLLLASAWLTYTSCNLLIKGAVTTRRRSYEYLAFHTFGPAGKLAVEISIIGLLIGTCVAFFVIIGDLGPTIISKMLGIDNTGKLRMFLMVFLAVFVALPLGLLRNIESLSNISAVSLGFYSVFIAEIFALAFPNLWSGIWVQRVVYWNPEGVFKCLPIFSLAFSCQSQLFVMYDALSDPSAKRMKTITKSAVGMCTSVYLMVGYFGYVAFCEDEVAGDILMNFRSTIFSEAVKLGFVLSVAVSFPLAIFPCRASIYTLLFAKEKAHHDNIAGPIFIPDVHFKLITFAVVFGTLTIGILVPNIEFVLALTGATMGSLICYIFPATMFISIMSTAKTNNKSMAQLVLFLGVTILLASTYVTLNSSQQEVPAQLSEDADLDTGLGRKVFRPPKFIDRHPSPAPDPVAVEDNVIKDLEQRIDKQPEEEAANNEDKEQQPANNDIRQEPPNPHAPLDDEDEEEEEKDEEKKEVKEKGEKEKLEEAAQKEVDAAVDDAGAVDDETGEEHGVEADTGKKDEGVKEVKELLVEMKKQQEKQEVMIAQQRELIQELKQHNEEHKVETQNQGADGQQEQPAEVGGVQQKVTAAVHPKAQQPAAQQPAVQQPAAQQPAAQQPAAQQPAAQQPAAQQPAAQQPAAQQPAAQQPAAQQPAAQQPAAQQPAAQQPAAQQLAAQQPAVQQPAAQHPAAQQPATQQPVAQQPAAQQPAAQQPAAQQPAAQQPVYNSQERIQQAANQVPQQVQQQDPHAVKEENLDASKEKKIQDAQELLDNIDDVADKIDDQMELNNIDAAVQKDNINEKQKKHKSKGKKEDFR